ncbi:MAG: hypothetical protein P1Q69_13785 [Candidatus Thorarchaeota archaeon]|nr:hypothetical protein [Candidatus Thorarchaeota archaeon]
MILGAYILRGTGERLYGICYEEGERVPDKQLPPHVQATVTLFHSRESTILGQPYTLEQNEFLWVYTFFESFVVVMRVTPDEEIASLSRRMVALGREIVHTFGRVMKIWSGNMGEIEGMDDLVDSFVELDLKSPDEMLPIIDSVLDAVFANHELVYAGVIDITGEMLSGNIPESHLSLIQEQLLHESVKPSTDVVPTTIEVQGYDVQILRVQSLTVAAASHKDGSKVGAKTAVSAIAQSLSDSIL